MKQFLGAFIDVCVVCVLTAERTGILVSAEDDILDVEDDDDELDASVESDEGIVTDDTASTDHGEAVTESDAEKVCSRYLCVPHFSTTK